MSMQRTMLGGLAPQTFQVSTVTTAPAVAVNSTVRALRPSVLDISIETNDVRYRADGTDPTLNTGVVLWSGVTYRFEGYNSTSAMKFCAMTGSATVSIQPYKHAGSG